MKQNIIIRIVIWSLVIFCLIGILLSGLGFRIYRSEFRTQLSSSNEISTPNAQSNMMNIPSEQVSEIDIDWYSGNIYIIPTDVDIITIGETEGDNPLVWKVEGNKLSIDFCEESIFGGLLLGRTAPKDLAISVPQNWQCRNLCVDSASSRLLVQDLTIRKVEIDSASGTSEFVNCTVEELNVDAASGDVRFEGNLDTLEFDAASASFTATLHNTPRNIEMDTASGNLDLTLPEDTGFTVRMQGIKHDFTADDFEIKMQNGSYIHGSGACRIDMDSMSGSVTLHKGA